MTCFLVSMVIFAFSSCNTAPPATEPPAWASNLEAEFPFDQFLAQKGTGSSASEAEASASRALAQYFQVNITVQAREDAVARGNNPTEITNIETTIRQVDIELFAFQFARPWYNAGDRRYETVAYINRDDAWRIFEPRVRREETAFLDMFNSAQAESGALKRFVKLRGTQNYYNVSLAPLRSYGERLHPVVARESFPDTDAALGTLPRLIDEARLQSTIFIAVNDDFENRISQIIESTLNSEGFRIARSRAEAAAVFTIDFNFNMTESRSAEMSTFSFAPSVQAVLSEGSTVIFSYRAPQQSRTSTVTEDAGKRRAIAALAAAMEGSFPAEFKQNMASFADSR